MLRSKSSTARSNTPRRQNAADFTTLNRGALDCIEVIFERTADHEGSSNVHISACHSLSPGVSQFSSTPSCPTAIAKHGQSIFRYKVLRMQLLQWSCHILIAGTAAASMAGEQPRIAIVGACVLPMAGAERFRDQTSKPPGFPG